MTRTCLGFAITTFLTCGAIAAATDAAFPVASTTTTSSFESFFAKASRRGRRMSTRPSRLSLPSSQATASAKARWISRPMIRMFAPPSLFVQGGSWRATRHLLIRAHGASGKVARGGHVTSSGSQPTVYRRPARTFVLPAPRVQDGLTISPSPSREQADSKAPTDHIPDNGQVDVALLHALDINAVDFLVTQDQGIHTRARRTSAALGNRILSVSDAVAWLRAAFESLQVRLPLVEELQAHSVPLSDDIFDSLREGYPGFNEWWRTKCVADHRLCWVVSIDGEIAGLVVRKEEKHAQAGTHHPGPKILKVCTFKVKPKFRGEKLGELLLKQILWLLRRMRSIWFI